MNINRQSSLRYAAGLHPPAAYLTYLYKMEIIDQMSGWDNQTQKFTDLKR